MEDARRGYRRVVPSPLPVRVLEAGVIQRLVEAGVIVIAVGGGGIPVRVVEDGLTGVEAKSYLADGHFAPGSMGPKIEAAIHFLEHGGREVVITRPEKALKAVDGRAGTRILPDRGTMG